MSHEKIKVLDHGYVQLIETMGSDEGIVEAARMSTGRGFVSWEPYERCKACDVVFGATEVKSGERHHLMLTHRGQTRAVIIAGDKRRCEVHVETDKFPRGDFGLLEYLYENGHTTPFEMAQFHFEVNAPIMVWRQLHRHRVFSYNEQSGRYGKLQDAYYVPTVERIKEAHRVSRNKQAGGSGIELTDAEADAERESFIEEQQAQRRVYERRLASGMAPELARGDVGVFQYSKCRVNGDLHNLLHSMLRQRLHSHAQWEVRQFAEAIMALVKKSACTRTWRLFEEHTLGGVRFSRTEIECLRGIFGNMPSVLDVLNFPNELNKLTPGQWTKLLEKLGVKP